MINDYPYAELFREHNVKKDMIIVDRTAQITPVSDHDPTIVGTYIFTSEDIKVESFDLTESLCSENDIRFGLCTSSQVKITVKNKPEYPNLKDEVLKIYIYFNGDSDTLFEVGQYRVDTDAYSDDRRFRDLSMFDLLYFLREYDITEWYNAIYADNNNQALKISVLVNDLMRWLSADENIPITYDTLPQINYTIPKNVTADNITFGFFLQPLLEVLGLFGHIDRTGKVVYKSLEWYDKPAVRTVTDDWRKPPTTWKDQYTWGIGQIDVYDENNIRLFYYRNTDKKHPSIYTIADSFVFSSRKADDAEAKALLEYMWNKTTHIRYKPYEAKTIGDLCVEVGDRIDVQCGDITFYTYVFERHLTGIQSMRDEYSARGNKKQPKYVIEKGSSYDDQGEGSSGSGTGGVSNVDNTDMTDFCEYIRNIGLRLLDEPSNVDVVYDKANGQVEIKWNDPADISTYAPVPCAWAGTVVVRREKEPPRHIWDGTIIATSTTRDAYSSNALVDSTIDQNKRYFYGIFPYHVALDDDDHPINHYRFTKVVSVDTTYDLLAPTIENLEVSGVDVTVTYDIPEIDGLYSYCKLVVKKGGIPADVEDGDVILTLNESLTEVQVTGLDEESRYYFVIFTADTDGNTANSDSPDAMTGIDEGWDYDYTGQEEVFEAPTTGVYSLETWGAQGGDATDGDLVARGGYGAYAYGEVFLNAGDKLYINVGGQNGYNGGGKSYISGTHNLEDIAYTFDFIRYAESLADNGGASSEANQEYWRPYYHKGYMLWGGTLYKRSAIWNAEGGYFEFPDDTSLSGEQNPHTVWHIPIRNCKNPTKLELDIQYLAHSGSSISSEHWIQIATTKFTSDTNISYTYSTSANTGMRIVRYPTSSSLYNDYYISDNNWHHCECDLSDISELDFITFIAIAGTIRIKNVKLTGAVATT